mgnify:CR=1 FL=1
MQNHEKGRVILALESSAGPASCALLHCAADGKQRIVASAAVYTGLTHSQTLLPMMEDLLKNAGIPMADVDILAVSSGPGSFTGIRIGVAAAKGLAFARQLPCAGVSTLAAMARGLSGIPFAGIILACMDARCGQIYTASFSCADGRVTRLTPDEALTIEEVGRRFQVLPEFFGKSVFLVGDGAELCYNSLKDKVPGLFLAPEAFRYQQAAGVALEAAVLAEEERLVTADELMPHYLRLPQAERELRAKQQGIRE